MCVCVCICVGILGPDKIRVCVCIYSHPVESVRAFETKHAVWKGFMGQGPFPDVFEQAVARMQEIVVKQSDVCASRVREVASAAVTDIPAVVEGDRHQFETFMNSLKGIHKQEVHESSAWPEEVKLIEVINDGNRFLLEWQYFSASGQEAKDAVFNALNIRDQAALLRLVSKMKAAGTNRHFPRAIQEACDHISTSVRLRMEEILSSLLHSGAQGGAMNAEELAAAMPKASASAESSSTDASIVAEMLETYKEFVNESCYEKVLGFRTRAMEQGLRNIVCQLDTHLAPWWEKLTGWGLDETITGMAADTLAEGAILRELAGAFDTNSGRISDQAAWISQLAVLITNIRILDGGGPTLVQALSEQCRLDKALDSYAIQVQLMSSVVMVSKALVKGGTEPRQELSTGLDVVQNLFHNHRQRPSDLGGSFVTRLGQRFMELLRPGIVGVVGGTESVGDASGESRVAVADGQSGTSSAHDTEAAAATPIELPDNSLIMLSLKKSVADKLGEQSKAEVLRQSHAENIDNYKKKFENARASASRLNWEAKIASETEKMDAQIAIIAAVVKDIADIEQQIGRGGQTETAAVESVGSVGSVVTPAEEQATRWVVGGEGVEVEVVILLY